MSPMHKFSMGMSFKNGWMIFWLLIIMLRDLKSWCVWSVCVVRSPSCPRVFNVNCCTWQGFLNWSFHHLKKHGFLHYMYVLCVSRGPVRRLDISTLLASCWNFSIACEPRQTSSLKYLVYPNPSNYHLLISACHRTSLAHLAKPSCASCLL